MFQKKTYTQLASEPDDLGICERGTSRSDYRTPYQWQHALLVLLLCIITSAGGFFLGVTHSADQPTLPEWAATMDRAPISYTKQTWHYDPTFGREPASNNATEAEWDALIPQGQGFVLHPSNARFPSAISAVHQLHCLYSIRRAIFRTPDGEPIAGLNMAHMEPPHLRHCFDYLRQSLLCAADSTLEPWNERLGGVSGWGVERVCRDYEGLRRWAEKRRINDREGFVEVGGKGKG